MMKVKLYHAAFEDKPEYVATWEFDPMKYGHKRAAEAVYSASQNLTKNGWGRDGGLNKDFRSTSVGDFVMVENMKYYCSTYQKIDMIKMKYFYESIERNLNKCDII